VACPFLVPISITSLKESNNSSLSFSLNCTTAGSPATTVMWTKDGTLLLPSSQISTSQKLRSTLNSVYDNLLTIFAEPMEVIGNYTCTVNNSVSAIVQETVTFKG